MKAAAGNSSITLLPSATSWKSPQKSANIRKRTADIHQSSSNLGIIAFQMSDSFISDMELNTMRMSSDHVVQEGEGFCAPWMNRCGESVNQSQKKTKKRCEDAAETGRRESLSRNESLYSYLHQVGSLNISDLRFVL